MGEWRTLRPDWVRPSAVACRLCGRPLFGRVWTAEVGGERADFCDPDCEALFVDYWLPRYGEARPPED
ncbi:MAG TPA: hypothetical protein VH721_02725 [Gaiellaceae bacterium]